MINPGHSPASCSLEQLMSSGLINNSGPLSSQCYLSQPFSHVIIDDFLNGEVALNLAREISAIRDRDYRVSFRSLAQKKLQLGDIKGTAPHIYPVHEALTTPSFVRFIEIVSGYSGLHGDRLFAGAGLQRYHCGGFSEIHLDSNRHPFDTGLHHRVNLLIFMNPAWREEWGGELVLWSSRNGRPVRPAVTVQPKFNRAVLFTVTRKSWHSVNRIRCPRGHSRNSIAIYYFNRIAAADDERPRSVIWHSRHSWPRQVLFELSNRVITLAKPHARYLRWLRSNKFDGVHPS